MPRLLLIPDRRVSRLARFAFLALLGLVSAAHGQATPAQSKPETKTNELLLEQPKSVYKERRQALMAKIAEVEKRAAKGGKEGDEKSAAKAPEVLVVLVGETDEPEDAKFRQNNWFAYLTGVDSPRASLILKVNSKEETLYIPQRSPAMERWTGPKLGPGPEGVAATGFAKVEPSSKFNSDLGKLIDEKRKDEFGGVAAIVYVVAPYAGSESGNVSTRLTQSLQKLAPSAKIKGVTGILGELRKIKRASEIALLQKAIDITGEAQAGVIRTIAPGVPEYKLEGVIIGEFVGGGGQRAGFPSIVGSGPNSTVLHYNANRRILESGDLVVIDIGAEYFYYTADITRTYPVSGKFTPRQREIYQLVLDAQEHAEKSFVLGKSTIGDLHRAVTVFLRNSPLRAKNAAGVEQTMDRFFIHGLGHELGMDVHDVGNTQIPLAPGEVFTIEPGIYIPGENLGVRIEDDYLVTKDGLTKMSKNIPVKVDDIERLIEKARKDAGKPKGVVANP